jgi:hypothetical protein
MTRRTRCKGCGRLHHKTAGVVDMANAAAIQGYGMGGKTKSIGRIPKDRVHNAAHPGFETIARKIARKEGLPMDRARAILAASTRRRLSKRGAAVDPALVPHLLRDIDVWGKKVAGAKPLIRYGIETRPQRGRGSRKRGRGFDGEFDAVAPIDRSLWNAQKRSRVNTGHTSLVNTGFY